MSLIAKSKAQAEHVSEQTQQQNDQKLKEARVEGKRKAVPLQRIWLTPTRVPISCKSLIKN